MTMISNDTITELVHQILDMCCPHAPRVPTTGLTTIKARPCWPLVEVAQSFRGGYCAGGQRGMRGDGLLANTLSVPQASYQSVPSL